MELNKDAHWTEIIFDAKAIYGLVKNRAFRNAFRKIPDSVWAMDPEKLEKIVRPTTVDLLLKNAFWNEIRLSVEFNRDVNIKNIYEGICTYKHWYYNVLNSPNKLVWIISLITRANLKAEIFIYPILDRIHELLEAPLFDKKNQVIYKNAKIILDLFDRIINTKNANGVPRRISYV